MRNHAVIQGASPVRTCAGMPNRSERSTGMQSAEHHHNHFEALLNCLDRHMIDADKQRANEIAQLNNYRP